VWEALQRSFTKEPYQIRRLLTEGAVHASDKRARFVGAEAYQAEGGLILRDLFQPDDGGWWQDARLLDQLARERLEPEPIRAEGWRWVEAAPDFPYGPRLLAGASRPGARSHRPTNRPRLQQRRDA
jgi:ParB family chromosome partitioning protein